MERNPDSGKKWTDAQKERLLDQVGGYEIEDGERAEEELLSEEEGTDGRD